MASEETGLEFLLPHPTSYGVHNADVHTVGSSVAVPVVKTQDVFRIGRYTTAASIQPPYHPQNKEPTALNPSGIFPWGKRVLMRFGKIPKKESLMFN